MWFPAPQAGPRPLLVGLHFWGSGYDNAGHVDYQRFCEANGWHFIYPNFRGPNIGPEATGSALAIADVVDAVRFAQRTVEVDSSRIYLVGASGGGHMALLMAGVHPEIWAGVSAWVGISDLTAWHAERRFDNQVESAYASQIEAACGGDPESDEKAAAECARRSPLTYLSRARGVNLDINAGIIDGHIGSVPVGHSLRAFNAVAAPQDRVSDSDIDFFVRFASVPPHLVTQQIGFEARMKPVLFRRESGRARITIFDGGHEIDYWAALSWLAGKALEPIARRRSVATR